MTPLTITPERQNQNMQEVYAAVQEIDGSRPVTGQFHLIAALAALRIETLNTGLFQALVLMESPAPPAGHALHDAFDEGRIALTERSARGQQRFGDVAELAGKYHGLPAFAHFEAGAAEELAAALLVADNDGWRLACSPEAESRYYATNTDDGLFDRAGAAECTVLMLAGRDDLVHAGTPAQVGCELSSLGGYDYVELAKATHMIPLERLSMIASLTGGFRRRSNKFALIPSAQRGRLASGYRVGSEVGVRPWT